MCPKASKNRSVISAPSYVNNQAWATAGNMANAVQQQIRLLYKGMTGEPDVILAGVPISYKRCVCLS